MNDTPATQPQDLREAFASLISMMLGLLRAHGLRGLIHLPAMWLAAREIRRLGEELTAPYDASKAGTLPPVPPPSIAPHPPATPCASARAATLRHRRPRPSQSAPRNPRAPNRRGAN